MLIFNRFLVSKDVKLHEFQQTVRKKLDIANEADALFFFINNKKIEKISNLFYFFLIFFVKEQSFSLTFIYIFTHSIYYHFNSKNYV